MGNLRSGIPATLPEELIELLAANETVRVERIVSRGHTSPEGFWYDQDDHELVFLLEGAARLTIEGRGPVDLGPGDWLLLDAHQRHRLDWSPPDTDTIWLAIHIRGRRPDVNPG